MTVEALLQILMAMGVGGLIGLERELHTGSGLRTMMLICLGATLFTLYGAEYGLDPSDRIPAAVVSGVGFLGAAMILRHRAGVFGFTTAAAVWLVAALGVGIGIEEYAMVAVATVLVLFALVGIPLARRHGSARQTLFYEVLGPGDRVRQSELHKLMDEHGLGVIRTTVSKEEAGIRYTWQATGPRNSHQSVMVALINSDLVKEFSVLQFDELS